MSAKEILELLVDGDGNLQLSDGVDALAQGITRLVKDGAQINANEALGLFTANVDHIARTLSEIILETQGAVVAAHAAITHMQTGKVPEMDTFDLQENLSILLLGFELEQLAGMYNALEVARDSREQDAT